MPANLENSAAAAGLEKVSFYSDLKEKQCKECSNYHTLALISHASKVMLKILQARFQLYVNHELPDIQAGFSKGRGTRGQIANIHWFIKKLEWVAISFSGGYSWSKDRAPIAYIAQGFFTDRATRDIHLSVWETFQKVGIRWEFSSAVHLFSH